MGESEFLAAAEEVLNRIEQKLDGLNDLDVVDVECRRSGNVLEVEFLANGSKVIVNSQAPMREMWVAARSGGFHYRMVDGLWRNTRDNTELFAALSQIVSEQGGAPVAL
ncbi:MAG: iron donor protein CyaY [Telluria sp.]